jgi:preprotein translocase subunit SecD
MLGLLAVAIPTINLKISDNYYRIRGIDPKDFSTNMIIPEFAFRPSLDLQGGKIQTFKINLDSIEKTKRKEELDSIKNTIFIRLLQSRVFNFELNSLVNEDRNEYKLVIKYPNNIDQNLLQVMITPGNISFYADDSLNTKPDETEEEKQNKPYGERAITTLKNEDIEVVNLISDARCYFNDPKVPRNFCLNIIFKETSKAKFTDALYKNPTPKVPLLVVIDGAPIAVQTGGQIFNPTTPGRELLVYPVVDDTRTATSVLGSLMNSTPITAIVEQEKIDDVSPLIQENILTLIKISLITAVLICSALLIYYFRNRGLFAVLASTIFIITNIAVMKMFNLILDMPLIIGFILSYSFFMIFVINLIFKYRTLTKSSLLIEELHLNYENHRNEYRNVTLMITAIAFVMAVLGTVFAISLFTSFAFGIILGLSIMYIAFPVLLPIIFLKSQKWQIW